MAGVLFRTCFVKTLTAKKIGAVLKHQQKLYKVMSAVSNINCQCYHTTTILLKTHQERFKMVMKEKKKLRKVEVWPGMTVKELTESTGRDVNHVLDALYYSTRLYLREDDVLEDGTIINNCLKVLNLSPVFVSNPKTSSKTPTDKKATNLIVRSPPPDPADLIKRRPIVTIMGHVDHGKTTLLDTLRNTNVVSSEFGGITQHIGAFNVTLKSGEKITFLDTPGHAAFSSMRLRGAHVTDIVVLVVAADDGVMEQTTESINMARTANVPIIVAINKIDKPDANIERTQSMLAQSGIHLEAVGGDVQSVNISALKNTNLDILMEAITVQAEIMDLKGDPKGRLEGVVIESSTDPGRGKLATVLIKRGSLKRGDYIVSGTAYAKVRSMFDHAGNILKQASLCDPVQVIGWRDLPGAGGEVFQVDNERTANKYVDMMMAEQKEKLAIEHKEASLVKLEPHLKQYKEELIMKRKLGIARVKKPKKKETEPDDGIAKLNVIIKADVAGSIEAILDTLETYKDDKKCRLNIVHYDVGPITETDVELAEIFNAIVYCFNIKGSRNLKKEISDKIRIRHYNVIYKMIDDLKEEIIQRLPSVTIEDVLGEADVLREFEINEKTKKLKVAGCSCSKGELKKNANFKLIRNNEVIYTGKLRSMRNLKQEVTTIKAGTECGLMLDNPTIPFETGDKIVCFNLRQERAKLRWNPGF